MNSHRPGLGGPFARGCRRTVILRSKVIETHESLSAEDAAIDRTAQAAEVAAQVLPIAKALLDSDAAESVETLRAKIAHHLKMRDGFSRGSLVWKYYDNRVGVLQAKYRAAIKKSAQERELLASRKEWAGLGKAGLVVGIGVGGAIIALLLSMAARRGRRAP